MNLIKGKRIYISAKGPAYHLAAKDLRPVRTGEEKLNLRITVSEDGDFLVLAPSFNKGNYKLKPGNKFIHHYWLVENGDELILWNHPLTWLAAWLFWFGEKTLKIHKRKEGFIYTELLNIFQGVVDFEFENDIKINKIQVEPKSLIKLSEAGNFLLIYPVVEYDGIEVIPNQPAKNIYLHENSELRMVKRDLKFESGFWNYISGLHKKFNPSSIQEYFYLSYDDVLKNFWFLNFFQKCKDQNIDVYGFDKLGKLKYNPNRPFISHS